MGSTLRIKFIFLYIAFGFLCLFTTATLGKQLIFNQLKEDTSQNLYQEANLIAANYLPAYFSEEMSVWNVYSQLSAMQTYLDSSLWFVDTEGTMIAASTLEGTSTPESIKDFDPAEAGSEQIGRATV